MTSGTSRAPSSAATNTRMPAGRPPLPIASASAGVDATRTRAPVAATSTLRAVGRQRAECPGAVGDRIEVRLDEALGEDPRAHATAALGGGDVAARPSPTAGHGQEHADGSHGRVVAGRRAQPPRDAAQLAGRDVDLVPCMLGRDGPERARGVRQRRRRGRPDRVARGDRGRHEDEHRNGDDRAAPPARQQRPARRSPPGGVQVAAELAEDLVGVARSSFTASPP